MKILKDADYQALAAKAANWDGITSAVKESNADFNAEEATPETVAEALATEPTENAELTTAQETIVTLEGTVKTHEATIASLTTQVENLKKGPAEKVATESVVDPAEAVVEETNELVDFANENKGDLNAIVKQAQEDGFLPSKK